MGLQQHLKERGLSRSTRQTYGRIAARIEGDPVEWLLAQAAARKKGLPEGTLLPLRAAVKHYLISEQGFSEEEAQALIPRIKARKAQRRGALLPSQLALLLAAVEKDVPQPSRTILKLLPILGLRISEMVTLRQKNLVAKGGRTFIVLSGKGAKKRVVPVPPSAQKVLNHYRTEVWDGDTWLFPSARGGSISAAAVRKHTRRLRQVYPDLGDAFSPHTLRHTFATLAVARGMRVPHLQAILGHEDIKTTQRYLHPSDADLLAAMDSVDR